MSTDVPEEGLPVESGDARVFRTDIQDEMRNSYLTYAMSVIISRALPDARDGLKPSQRRILVAMNDLNLGPGGGRKKCAKIAGRHQRQLPPSRRRCDLSNAGPDGSGNGSCGKS